MLPVSISALSVTANLHVPFAELASRFESGSAGLHVPVHGAMSDVTDENGFAAASSNTTWHMLLPPEPSRANSVAAVPSGAVSVPVRSPTNVWSMPTVVAPSAAVHVAPSTENVSFDA